MRLCGYTLLLFCLVCGFLIGPAHAQDKQRLIVFYDPDANHQAILDIMESFDTYLKESGVALKLQPVTSIDKLEQLLGSPQVDFAIVSSTYLKEHAGKLKPLLVPEANGQQYYRKQLLDRGGSTPLDLSKKNIAATAGDKSDRTALLAMLKRGGVPVDGALVIPVAKDVDALLALTFGQVQAALVTQASIDVLKRINPVAAQSLRKIYETDRILRSPLCALGENSNSARLISVLQRMDKDPVGRRAIASLGFDRWTPYDPSSIAEPK